MVARPMQGDGPPVHEAEPPYTLGEIVATCDDSSHVIGALCYARGWTEDVPKSWLAPWKQIGPEMIWAVNRQTEAELHKIGPVVTSHVEGLKWVRGKRLSRLQVELAVADAFDRVVYGDCMSAAISAMRVACRKETFLQLRAEAVAFMVFAMGLAECGLREQLGNCNTP